MVFHQASPSHPESLVPQVSVLRMLEGEDGGGMRDLRCEKLGGMKEKTTPFLELSQFSSEFN